MASSRPMGQGIGNWYPSTQFCLLSAPAQYMQVLTALATQEWTSFVPQKSHLRTHFLPRVPMTHSGPAAWIFLCDSQTQEAHPYTSAFLHRRPSECLPHTTCACTPSGSEIECLRTGRPLLDLLFKHTGLPSSPITLSQAG